jgi:WD40 repeat protein
VNSREKSELLSLKTIGLLGFLLILFGCTSSPTSTSTLSSTPNSIPSPFPTSTPKKTDSPTPQANDLDPSNPIFKFNSWEIVHDLAYSPDGSVLGVSAGNRIRIFDAETLAEKLDILLGAWTNRMDFHPGLPLITLAVKDGSIQFRDIASGEIFCQFIAHERGIYSLSITPDGEMLITSGTEILSRLWDISSLSNGDCEIQELGTFIGESYSSPEAAFSPDGRSIALVDMSNIRLRKTSDRKLIALLESDITIFDIAFSPDGHWLAAAQHQDTVTVWDLTHADNPVATVLHPPDSDLETYIWRVAFNPESKLLAAGTSDGSIAIWNLDDLRIVQTHHLPRAVSALAFSPDGEFLAAGGLDASIWLFPLNP